MTQNYFIYVSNGILDKEHQKKIGNALWQYLWCLDKVTKIDKDGYGLVWGGKPIKLEDIGGIHTVNVSKNLAKLKKAGYLDLKRTPYGLIVRVVKVKKFYGKDVKLNSKRLMPEDYEGFKTKEMPKVDLNHPTGEDHHNWKGGITPENSKIRASAEYKEWRMTVFKRDDFTCQNCKIKGSQLEAHHIVKFSEDPTLRFEISNGLTLCRKCHKEVTFKKKSISESANTGISENAKPVLAKTLNRPAKTLNVIKTIHYDNTLDIYKHYQEKINKGSKLLDKAKEKIKARLKVYSLDDLKKAMDNFSADGWWMKNNAHRGVAWFFHSDERIEQLMNMKPRAGIISNINQPLVAEDKYNDL